ncbi:hypothetical protein FRC10_006558 [Ceratobasidium sp. 414]|nr:hypothetical protein FRC10_006558 [Ceratobasidium sp. 414]
MAEPIARGPEGATDGPTPEVHFAETVSVVTGVNNLAETPLVDAPLESTTADNAEGATVNEQIRRSASRDRDMKDEEGLVLKAIPREPSEESATAAQTAEVAEGVENLEITSNPNAAKKRKQNAEEKSDVPASNHSAQNGDDHIPADANDKPQYKTRRGSAGGKKRSSNKTKGAVVAENEPAQELRRSKRRKSA